MGTVVRIPFEVTGWEPEPISLGEDGGGVALAVELVTGTVEGRSGTFVLQHTGVVHGANGTTSGVVLPGTATGELTGLRGGMTITHGEAGAVLTLDYDLP